MSDLTKKLHEATSEAVDGEKHVLVISWDDTKEDANTNVINVVPAGDKLTPDDVNNAITDEESYTKWEITKTIDLPENWTYVGFKSDKSNSAWMMYLVLD